VSLAASAEGEGLAVRLLRDLVRALFTAEPRCRRVIAAPDEDDTATQLLLEEGGFRRVTEADLPRGTVVLYAVEPPGLATLSTALDDMPH
jgi:RimJ/RimL family protein N-acetyltransferase